jgi:plastocyanin
MNKLLRAASIALVLSLLMVAGIGCSKSATSTTTSSPPATTTSVPLTITSVPLTTTSAPPITTSVLPTTTTTTPPPITTGVSTNQVTIQGFTFIPYSITVPVGTKVTWTNLDNTDHTVTFTDPSIFNSSIGAGATISITFTVPGTYNYLCTTHPSMTGVVIVIK